MVVIWWIVAFCAVIPDGMKDGVQIAQAAPILVWHLCCVFFREMRYLKQVFLYLYIDFKSLNLHLWTLGGDKVSMLTHTYPHKPLRKIKVTMCNHQADSQLYVWPDVWSYGHTWHRMSLLRPGVIKQQNRNPAPLVRPSWCHLHFIIVLYHGSALGIFSCCCGF